MAKHLYKTPILSTRKGTIDRQVKSNPRNKLIHGRHHCGKGRNARGIITARHRGGGHKRLYRKIDFRRIYAYRGQNEKAMELDACSKQMKSHTFPSECV